jgi:hypothetical protein
MSEITQGLPGSLFTANPLNGSTMLNSITPGRRLIAAIAAGADVLNPVLIGAFVSHWQNR